MKDYEIKIKKKTFMIIVILIGLVLILGISLITINSNSLSKKLREQYNNIPTPSGKAIFLKQSENLKKSVDPELLDLDSQIISCAPNVDSLLSTNPNFGGSCLGSGGSLKNTTGLYLSGQCCGALMNTKEMHENLKKLQQYKEIKGIVLDPFHTSIKLAKKWIDYDHNTSLNSEQQKIYDKAIKLSMEGPCCCKCWHYYVNEGIAKKMIIDYNYTAQQIANYWDYSDICGD